MTTPVLEDQLTQVSILEFYTLQTQCQSIPRNKYLEILIFRPNLCALAEILWNLIRMLSLSPQATFRLDKLE